jgi:hypothetical protein
MKIMRIIRYILGLTVLTTLVGASQAHAQSEIDPDHFETTDTLTQAAPLHYVGKFILPYTVQCDGRRLPPGRYSISLDSDGRVARATLLRKGQAFKIQGIAQRQNHPSRNALVVERNGGVPQLSVIHASQMELKLDRGVEHRTGGARGTIDELALIAVNPLN